MTFQHDGGGIIRRYAGWLPVPDGAPVISLGEGATPLIPAPVLSAQTGCEVYLKVEGANPTASFKDRGMTVAVSMAAAQGAKAVICASTGNTSASAAAYAARAGLTCAVLVPRGKIALGKLAQALVHGARLLQVDGNFDDCLELARKLAADHPVALVNSVNPDRLRRPEDGGVRDHRGARATPRTCTACRSATPATSPPTGWATASTPRPGRRPGRRGCSASRPAGPRRSSAGSRCSRRSTIATAIRIGNPASWRLAEEARDASGGLIDSVTDRQILAAYRLLAAREAVFGELASAAGVAGLLQARENGQLDAGSVVVCTITGNGLKDPDWAVSAAPQPVTIPVDVAAAATALGLA